MRNQKKLNSIIAEIHEFCSAHADAKQVARYARYFKEGFDAYGLVENQIMELKEKILQEHGELLGLNGFLDLGDRLFQSGKYEEGSIAILTVESFREQFTPDTFQRIGKWLEDGVRNWAHTDVICGRLLSPAFEKRTVTLDALADWRKSASKWKRRAVPVSMLILLKLELNYQPLLDFVDSMMMDAERVVHQGLGWFLREAWKKQPEPVEAFLLRWKDSAARLIFQYATEKMSAEDKAQFKKSKSKK